MAGRKLYSYYVRVVLQAKELNGQHKRRTTLIKASSPLMALHNAVLNLKKRDLHEIRGLYIDELPPDHPEPVAKETQFNYWQSDSDRYYECKATGERFSIEKYNALPDFILPRE